MKYCLALMLCVPLYTQTILHSGESVQIQGHQSVWSVNPNMGTVSSTGLYTAPPLILAPQTVVVSETVNSVVVATTQVLLVPSTITMPIEVGGMDGTSVNVPFVVPVNASLVGPFTFTARIHNIKYETEASMKINNGPWIPLNTSTVTLPALVVSYGGIGGGFTTFRLSIPLPGTIAAGSNTVSFRFNGTDGAVSMFRVLEFSIINGSGSIGHSG